jgi:hypothetical protein
MTELKSLFVLSFVFDEMGGMKRSGFRILASEDYSEFRNDRIRPLLCSPSKLGGKGKIETISH